MTNRRRFLSQGALTACALTFMKPKGILQDIFVAPNQLNKLSILTIIHGKVANNGIELPKVVNAHELKLLDIEADKSVLNNIETPISFQIEKKGNTNIGIMYLNEDLLTVNNVKTVSKINETASILKKQYACGLVICKINNETLQLSNHFTIEKELASSSSNIDLIVCKKNNKAKYKTFISHDSTGNEVIISAAIAESVGTIDITFNHKTQKINIA